MERAEDEWRASAAWLSVWRNADSSFFAVNQSRGIVMPRYTAIVTLLAVAFYFFLATRVAVARGKFKVELPATTGNPDFERVFRVHINTLEWMPTFLAPLWLCAIYFNDITAAVLGLIWIGGRAMYFGGYSKAV